MNYPTIRDSVTLGVTGYPASPCSITLPAYETGDLIVGMICISSGNIPSAPSGWTIIGAGTNVVIVWTRVKADTGTTFSSTISGTAWCYAFFSINNADTLEYASTSGSGGTSDPPAITATIAGKKYVEFAALFSVGLYGTAVIGVPSGFTEVSALLQSGLQSSLPALHVGVLDGLNAAVDPGAFSVSAFCGWAAFSIIIYCSSGECDGTFLGSAAESLDFDAAVSAQPTYRILDALRLQATPSTTLELSATLTEQLTLTDAIGFIANLLASDGLTLSDDLTGTVERALLLAETLVMTSSSTPTLELAKTLLESLAFEEVASAARALTAQETLTLADAITSEIEATLQAQETLALASEIRSSFVLIASDALELSDSLVSTLEVLLTARDTLAFIGSLPLSDGDYQAWVMNADTTGVTSYANFPMDSLFTYQGAPYGLTSTGLYKLEGADDDGTAIDTVVATGDLQFGTSRLKNVPRAYLYITQSGQTILKTISSLRGSRNETFYELAERTSDGGDDLTYRRVPLGRGVRGEWWRFEIHSVDGASIDLGGAEVLPVVLSRRG